MRTPWMTDARPAWLEEATTWIDEQRLGTIRDVSVVHERIWGAVLRVAMDDRVLHFKALGLGCTHETAVLRYLGSDWPLLAPTIHAIDEARGWLLLGDDGCAMYETDPARQVMAMEQVLGGYAQMQRASAERFLDLIDAGIPDRRMTRTPRIVEGILDTSLTFGRELPVTSEQRTAIERLLPALDEVCGELAKHPQTLEHGDLHNKNILVRDEHARIIDWGDACVTHPFCSLFPIYLISLPRMDLDKSAAARLIAEAYLEGFDRAARELLPQAMWIAHVTRAFHYVHMLDGMEEPTFTEWMGYAAELLILWAERYEAMRDGTIVDVIVNTASED